jgi:hypothetical protein
VARRVERFARDTTAPEWIFRWYAGVRRVAGGGSDFSLDWSVRRRPWNLDAEPVQAGSRYLDVFCRLDSDPPCTVDEDWYCGESPAAPADAAWFAVTVIDSGVFAGSLFRGTQVAGWVLDLTGIERATRLALRGMVSVVEAYGLSRPYSLVVEDLTAAAPPEVCGDRPNWLPWLGIRHETLPPPDYDVVLDPRVGGAVELARVRLPVEGATIYFGDAPLVVPVDVPCVLPDWRAVRARTVLRVRLDPLLEEDPRTPTYDGRARTAGLEVRFSFDPGVRLTEHLWLEAVVDGETRPPVEDTRTWTARQVLARNSLR